MTEIVRTARIRTGRNGWKGRFLMTHERRTTILWLVAGTFVMAAATNLFFVPADVVAGGFTGLAMFIRHLTKPLVREIGRAHV